MPLTNTIPNECNSLKAALENLRPVKSFQKSKTLKIPNAPIEADAAATAATTTTLATLPTLIAQTPSSTVLAPSKITTPTNTTATSLLSADLDNSRSSDSGKSSSCSPTLLDCSFDSGIVAGVDLVDCGSNTMQLHKRIQQCQRILLALERDREHFTSIRNRLSKISDRKKKKLNEDEYFCNVCCAEINPEDAKTYVKCYVCQKHICRGIKCADWLPKTAEWECELCQTSKESMAQTSSWVAEQISFNQQKLVYPMRARSEIFIPINDCNDSSIHFESVSQIGANSALITAEQKSKIREYVEEIVAKLLEGNLDTISVNQLSKSENYLKLFYKYHSPLRNILINLEKSLTFSFLRNRDLPISKTNGQHHSDSPSRKANGSITSPTIITDDSCSRDVSPAPTADFGNISEARLRQMVQKIIAETMEMPPLLQQRQSYAVSEIALDRRSKALDNMQLGNGVQRRHRTEHYFEPKIYQDLLATAVLNKIADKQSNIRNLTESSPDLTHNNPDCEHEILDKNFNIENQSTTSGSSIEPRSDCSYTDMDQILNTTVDDKSSELIVEAGRESVMSDYLASHMVPLPDFSTHATESEEDDYMSVTSSAIGDGTWEENWLFKKRKSGMGSSVAASSVGILVPNPKEDVRAQIGDKTADEVSDLSELGSDTDDSLDLLTNKLDPPNDRLLNKHLIGGENSKLVLDELIERSSMISHTSPMEHDPEYAETRNEHLVNSSNITETVTDNNRNQQLEADLILPPSGFDDNNNNNNSDSNPLSGSIAEREYKKWYNAVEMPNNPYAPEALKRRISGSQERFIDLPNISPTKEQNPLELITQTNDKLEQDETNKRENEYKRYSRDYYINEGTKDSPSTAGCNKETVNQEVNDCQWTLSKPVRRSSSLKHIDNGNSICTSSYPNCPISPKSHHHHSHASTTQLPHRSASINYCRPSTSSSLYKDDEVTLRDQRSWNSSSTLFSPPKRRTLSMLSVYSGRSSNNTGSSSNRSRSNHTDANVLTQFEKQLLHKDLKRNSFRAVSATTKDFVINPLFEKEQFFNGDGGLKLSIAKPKTMLDHSMHNFADDQAVDSGIDSYLNGFSEREDKATRDMDSLMF